MTQPERLLNYLTEYGPITALGCWAILGVYRASDAAHKLRKKGYPVHTKIVEVKNKFGEVIRVAEYRL